VCRKDDTSKTGVSGTRAAFGGSLGFPPTRTDSFPSSTDGPTPSDALSPVMMPVNSSAWPA
jgi:hypothetical protein